MSRKSRSSTERDVCRPSKCILGYTRCHYVSKTQEGGNTERFSISYLTLSSPFYLLVPLIHCISLVVFDYFDAPQTVVVSCQSSLL